MDDGYVLAGRISVEKPWEEPFGKKKRGQPKSGQLLLPGGKPLRHGAEEKSQGRDSKASDIFPLLKAVGLEAFHGVFCQHELDKAELKHWNPVNLFPSCFQLPAGPLRRLLDLVQEECSMYQAGDMLDSLRMSVARRSPFVPDQTDC